MTDFGRRKGDMQKSVYDTDDSGVVDDAEGVDAHAADHQNAGDDEISVEGLSGELADDQPPKAHALGSASHSAATLEALNAKVSDATLDKTTDTRTPAGHKTSHESGGSDEISLAGMGAGSLLVDRGDPASPDWQVGALTCNEVWQDLDCSGIVPEGATWILIRVHLVDGDAQRWVWFRKKGNSNEWATYNVNTQVGNINRYVTRLLPCDVNRVIQYKSGHFSFGIFDIVVLGWVIG